jgi:diacylglycerol kinase (ATP)
MTPERVGAVVNPQAGSGDAAQLFSELAGCFPEAAVEAHVTTGAADVPDAAREQAAWADLLAVVGGDGTLREVAAALVEAGEETPLLVVPAGRGNSSYRHLYGDDDWREVARRIARGMQRRPLDVGRVEAEPSIEETYFVLGFTAGLFRNAVVNAERFRALPGALAYVLATGQAVLVDDPVEASVTVDGEPFFEGAARLVAVGGGRYRGGDFELFPASRAGDGRLHAVAIEPVGPRGSISLARLARAGRLDEHPAVHDAAGESVTLRSDSGLPVEMDGTPIGTALAEASVGVRPGALAVAQPSSPCA